VRAPIAESWVVYTMPVKGIPAGARGICEQAEWDAMERARPGVNTLIRGGMTNEGEAERLARGASGEGRRRNTKAARTSWAAKAATLPAATGTPPD
jgi:hypothetical protein